MRPGVVLVGGPGSGKSTVGAALAASHGYWYADREAELLAKYGSREAFLAVRDEALHELHSSFVREIGLPGPPWVYESTGLTERDFVLQLRQEHGGMLVHLDVPLAVALERVAAREAGRNLSNDAAAVRRVWQACRASYETLDFDFVLDASSATPEDLTAAVRRWHLAAARSQD